MRADTLDGRERYNTISYGTKSRSIRIAQNHLVGATTHVPGETIQLARSRVFDSGMDEGIIPLSDTASSWSVNKGIANRHSLVVYGGGIGEELVRLIPSI